jgi:hypothetical protein
MIKPGEEILGAGGQRLRVVDVVPFEEADDLGFVGLLKGVSRSPGPTGRTVGWASVRECH